MDQTQKGKETTKIVLPSIGRIVLFHYRWSKHQDTPLTTVPAIVTEVEDMRVSLNVFTHTGVRVHANVPYAEAPTQDHWSWPPRS